jgi:valyl-tRNA synthetase
MEKNYQPQAIEQSSYQQWESRGYFKPSGHGAPYSIMIPPPNVTGHLHMGHGFQLTLMDALIRYHRMQGHNTLWQPGTDHAGIATQMVVERQLNHKGKSKQDLGRDAFIDKVWEWKEESGGRICEQIRELGASVDWSRERFTMDEGLSHSVNTAFVSLYHEGLIYRGKRLVNWDPKLHTAISDLEVINSEEQGHLWHISYPVVDSEETVTIATTRPETLLGDTAVAVHPEDKRYQHLVGQKLKLPLTDRTIPIIADDYVDPEFGSGCVKITPGHDFNDYEVGQRHQLPLINIFTSDANINQAAPSAYQGLSREAAREKILHDLNDGGFLVKTDAYTLNVPRGDRSGVIIEPLLTDQWYVKTKPLAEPALKAVRDGEIRFIPENWNKTYYQWLDNIQDWCISRQLWWGHRIPAWYDDDSNVYVGLNEDDVRTRYKLEPSLKLRQEEDVLDTWFSASLWPFATLDWPQQTDELKAFYPGNVLVTGFDIIFFWVARMIMMGLKFQGKIPFKEVYITGLIRDAQGHKMSKSKGNVLDPLDLIHGISLDDLVEKRTQAMMQPHLAEHIEKTTRQHFPEGITAAGTDALRFTFCSLASNTRNIRFELKRLEGYRNFCNKLWNASRYVLMNLEKTKPINHQSFSLADHWIDSQLQQTIQQARRHFENYRFDLLAQCLYDFTWNQYCDWYLELSKCTLYSEHSSEQEKQSTCYRLMTVLDALLRLLHPIIPFITEAIWQQVAPLIGKHNESIMMQAYPTADDSAIDSGALAEIDWLKTTISAIRNLRTQMNIAPGKRLNIICHKGGADDKEHLQRNKNVILNLCKLDSIRWLEADEIAPEAMTALSGEMEMLIPMAGLINIEEETQRLDKAIQKTMKECERCENKLNNPNFVKKAPQAVIEQEQKRIEEYQSTLAKLRAQRDKLCSKEPS